MGALILAFLSLLYLSMNIKPTTGTVHSAREYRETNCADNKIAIVHLFEWRWADVARECELYLGPRRYCGVQVSPVNEHRIVNRGSDQPWWQRYQPVSYKIQSRSGTEKEFEDMVERCNGVGVRIYVDVVLNHMTETGTSGVGSAGSSFDTGAGYFPGVSFDKNDFNDCSMCSPKDCGITDWKNTASVRNCRHQNRIDIQQSRRYVQDKQVSFLNKLIEFGVAGFRIGYAKHMWPRDLEEIWKRMDNLSPNFFDDDKRPFVFLEMDDSLNNYAVASNEYGRLGKITDFRYSSRIAHTIGNLDSINGIHEGLLASDDAVVFVDNHETQRGIGSGNTDVLTFRKPYAYKKAHVLTLANGYGMPRIMSSYNFKTKDEGPPHNKDMSIKPVIYNRDGSCGNGWVCEHRWEPISGLAGFAKATLGEAKTNMWRNDKMMAFSRGKKGFFAITNAVNWTEELQTGLPAGQYCDVVQGCPTNSGCTGGVIVVKENGKALIQISNTDEPYAAIHVEARYASGGCEPAWTPIPPLSTETTVPTTTTTPTSTRTASNTTTTPMAKTSSSTRTTTTLATTTKKATTTTPTTTTIPTTTITIPTDTSTASSPTTSAQTSTPFMTTIAPTSTITTTSITTTIPTSTLTTVKTSPSSATTITTTLPTTTTFTPTTIITAPTTTIATTATTITKTTTMSATHTDNTITTITPTTTTTVPATKTTTPTSTTIIPTTTTTTPTATSTSPAIKSTTPTSTPTTSTTKPTTTITPTPKTTIPTTTTMITTTTTTTPTTTTTTPTTITTTPTTTTTTPTTTTTTPTTTTTIPTTKTTTPTTTSTLSTTASTATPIPTTPTTTTPTTTTTTPTTTTTTPTTTTTLSTTTSTATPIPTTPTTTKAIGSTLRPGWKRTVIFLRAYPPFNRNIFYIGGINDIRGAGRGCIKDPDYDPCAMSIEHNVPGKGPHYEAYNAWSAGDTKLDWHGPQRKQGTYRNIPAKGTPAVWTTNVMLRRGYQPLNVYGESYYMADFNMDCRETENGWFEFKGWEDGKAGSPAERDVGQGRCAGSAGGKAPYTSWNHVARCGFVNVFQWGNGNFCIIDNFPVVVPTPPVTIMSTPRTPASTLRPGWKRTIIFLRAHPPFSRKIFFIGGIGHERRHGCYNDAERSRCALAIDHNIPGFSGHYAGYNAWSIGDTKLDWYGAQVNQGKYGGRAAKGTPAVWTTHQMGHPGYQPLNIYGESYYMADFNMDCSETESGGWFEFKGWEDGKGPGSPAEKDMNQYQPCIGSLGGMAPYNSPNHMGRCGFINVFQWEVGHICRIDYFPRHAPPHQNRTTDNITNVTTQSTPPTITSNKSALPTGKPITNPASPIITYPTKTTTAPVSSTPNSTATQVAPRTTTLLTSTTTSMKTETTPSATTTEPPSTADASRSASNTASSAITTPPKISHKTTETTTTESTTLSTSTSRPSWRRTVILLRAVTKPGENLFFIGGIGHHVRSGCTSDTETSLCAIPIEHNVLGSTPHYNPYNAWRKGDTRFDWNGAQKGQGRYNNDQALGTPSAWTTSENGKAGYQPLNKYGREYWMVDFQMDCSQTEYGWFELKARVDKWKKTERDMDQKMRCIGTAGGLPPYKSVNHMARCGFTNVFWWEVDNKCIIDHLDMKSVTPSLPPPTGKPRGWQRTVVFIFVDTEYPKNVFLLGGISHKRRKGCTENARTSRCAISIKHNELGRNLHYIAYNAWKIGDTKLDLYGAQYGQGYYEGRRASGTPAVWTTTDRFHPGFQPLNKYGRAYWMVDFNMDCSATEKGWFEFKAYVAGRNTLEKDLSQTRPCKGNSGGMPPYSSKGHMGKCGHINVFAWQDSNACEIESFSHTVPPSLVPPTLRPTSGPGWRRTIILLHAETKYKQFLFFLGGIEHERRSGCTNNLNADTSPCAISIKHNSLGTDSHYNSYNAWRKGDTKLDWYLGQEGQGTYEGMRAEGTPAAWTTNNRFRQGHQPLNKYGDSYWMADFDMDCSQAHEGWFEVKGRVLGWNPSEETVIRQNKACSGDAGGFRPYHSKHHMGRCGFINVFRWKEDGCHIENLIP